MPLHLVGCCSDPLCLLLHARAVRCCVVSALHAILGRHMPSLRMRPHNLCFGRKSTIAAASVQKALSNLEMPRFTRRYPKLADAVLRQMLELTKDFETEYLAKLEEEQQQKQRSKQQQQQQRQPDLGAQPQQEQNDEGEEGDQGGDQVNQDQEGQSSEMQDVQARDSLAACQDSLDSRTQHACECNSPLLQCTCICAP